MYIRCRIAVEMILDLCPLPDCCCHSNNNNNNNMIFRNNMIFNLCPLSDCCCHLHTPDSPLLMMLPSCSFFFWAVSQNITHLCFCLGGVFLMIKFHKISRTCNIRLTRCFSTYILDHPKIHNCVAPKKSSRGVIWILLLFTQLNFHFICFSRDIVDHIFDAAIGKIFHFVKI